LHVYDIHVPWAAALDQRPIAVAVDACTSMSPLPTSDIPVAQLSSPASASRPAPRSPSGPPTLRWSGQDQGMSLVLASAPVTPPLQRVRQRSPSPRASVPVSPHVRASLDSLQSLPEAPSEAREPSELPEPTPDMVLRRISGLMGQMTSMEQSLDILRQELDTDPPVEALSVDCSGPRTSQTEHPSRRLRDRWPHALEAGMATQRSKKRVGSSSARQRSARQSSAPPKQLHGGDRRSKPAATTRATFPYHLYL